MGPIDLFFNDGRASEGGEKHAGRACEDAGDSEGKNPERRSASLLQHELGNRQTAC